AAPRAGGVTRRGVVTLGLRLRICTRRLSPVVAMTASPTGGKTMQASEIDDSSDFDPEFSAPPDKPWKLIWLKPRAAVKAARRLEEAAPRAVAMVSAALGGLVGSGAQGQPLPLAVPLGLVLGLLVLYVMAHTTRFVSAKLGGQGTPLQQRKA